MGAGAHGRVDCGSPRCSCSSRSRLGNWADFGPRSLAQLISVISLLSADTPNTDSPANIDAAKEVREDIKTYRRKVRRLASKSAEEYGL